MHGIHANFLAAMRTADLFLRDIDVLMAYDLPHLDCGIAMTAYARARNIPIVYIHHSPFAQTHLISVGTDYSRIVPRGSSSLLNPSIGSLKEINLAYMRGVFGFRAEALRVRRFLGRVARDLMDIDLVLDHIVHARLQRKFRCMLDRASESHSRIQELTSGFDYVYFPLHLQPEMTTHLLGGIYSNQLLAIERLRGWLPSDVRIVVKENPKQTYRERSRLFYELIAGLPNVALAPISYGSRQLIDKAVAVATISGTAGFEALQAAKPCILFGNTWYQDFPGVLRVCRLAEVSYEDLVSSSFDGPGFEAKIAEFKDSMVRAGSITDMHAHSDSELPSAKHHSALVAESIVQALNHLEALGVSPARV
ncbi:hypothetical protein [Vulcanococcus limneticus]|uniref:capsular polysaccharide export protein, LipB/KpsS family n=1 Tax=Vulcanococcus limneticus TaxID=2170428 RepID=UPI00398BD9EB